MMPSEGFAAQHCCSGSMHLSPHSMEPASQHGRDSFACLQHKTNAGSRCKRKRGRRCKHKRRPPWAANNHEY